LKEFALLVFALEAMLGGDKDYLGWKFAERTSGKKLIEKFVNFTAKDRVLCIEQKKKQYL